MYMFADYDSVEAFIAGTYFLQIKGNPQNQKKLKPSKILCYMVIDKF